MLSPRLQLKVAQKQILTPGLVQMVTVLHLNRLELKEMINQEIIDNPVLEESLDAEDEISPEELQPLLEAERSSDLGDKELLDAADIRIEADSAELINATNFTETVYERIPGGNSGSSRHGGGDGRRRDELYRSVSTKSTSDRFLTIISIPAIKAPRRNPSRSLRLKPFSRSRRRCRIICGRSSASVCSTTKPVTRLNRSSAISTTTAT